MSIDCDVLVVGAGPAGASAARAAALGGAKTIFIDKKKEVGVPVQCAETISKHIVPLLPFKIPTNIIKWETEGISFWSEELTVERKGGYWSACAIDREKSDKWLVDMAIDAGAKFSIETELIDLEIDSDSNVRTAVIRRNHSKKEINPKLVIAADGVDSRVIEKIGIDVRKEKNIGKILSYEVKNANLSKPKMDQIFIGDFAPGVYAYIFPKSADTANVGVGTVFSEKELNRHYEDFFNIPMVHKQLKNSKKVKEKSGKAPFRYMTDEWVYGNVMLVGDTASQNIKPFGEGYIPAIICGSIVGEVSSDFVKFNKSLNGYQERVRKKFGPIFNHSDKLAEVMHELSITPNKKNNLLRLGLFANIFKIDEVKTLLNEDEAILKNKLKI